MQQKIEKFEKNEQKRFKILKENKKRAMVSLIGYTNSGKSAILNNLAKKEIVKSQNWLFETLSTKMKQIHLIDNFDITLVDTIGFVNNLPHELI